MTVTYAKRRVINLVVHGACVTATLLAVIPLLVILGYIVFKGAGSLNWAFFTELPKPPGEPGGGMANAIVGTLTLVMADIDSRSATTTTVKADGTTGVQGGLLTGDTSTSQFRSQLMQAATYPVNGVSPSSVGIILGRDGSVTFDADKFASALKKDPVGTATFVQTLAQRVQDTADAISDPYVGALTSRIKSQDSLVKQYTTQIADWDTRLDLRRSTLQATYSNLEVKLQSLNSQSSWLSSQLANLPKMA